MVRHMHFDDVDLSSIPPFAELFFLPFQISYRIRKAFIFNKIEGNNQKVENKVSGRVRVRAILTIGLGGAEAPGPEQGGGP